MLSANYIFECTGMSAGNSSQHGARAFSFSSSSCQMSGCGTSFHIFFSDLLSVWSRLTLIRRKFFLKEIRKRRYLFLYQDLVKDSTFAVGRKKIIMTVSDSA